jgi:hypothetical protein
VIRPLLGDGGGTVDQGVSTFLFIGALLFGWVSVLRLRGRAFRRLPRAAGWGVGALAVSCVVLALVLPPIIRPDTASTRPSTRARVAILSPQPGEVFRGSPAVVAVRLQLIGGKIVSVTSTKLNSTDGHIHLFLDGALVAMSYQLTQNLQIAPGNHVIAAEFVALDHGPFDPDVRASVAFRVIP